MTTIPLDEADIAPGRALRTEFARFWSTAQGAPRDIYDRFIGATPIAENVAVQRSSDESMPGMWVRPAGAAPGGVMLYLHGGGYIQGSATAYTGFVSQIAVRAKTAAFALDYPLAPEAPFPAGFDMAVTTIARLAAEHSAVAVVGDSAGGGLTLAALAQAHRDGVRTRAGVVFSPFADLSLSGSSMREFAIGDPLLDPAFVRDCASAYRASAPADNPRVSPLFDIKEGLPPLLIQAGSDEILLDDSVRFADGVEKAGGSVELEVWQGMHHVFQLNVSELASARAALDNAGAFLHRHLG
jgi:epsilon-lactone hydrolase